MAEMREIVDAGALGRLFVLLAGAGLLLGPGVGYLLGARRGDAKRGLAGGVWVGLAAVLNALLWYGFNAVMARLGIDRAGNLVANVMLFVLIGGVVGVAWGRWLRGSTGSALTEQEGESA